MGRLFKLPKEYVLTQYPHNNGVRYDIHHNGKNIGYGFIKELTGGDELWLGGLHILPKYQGKGLGKCLMKVMERDYKGRVIKLRARPYKTRNLSTDELIVFYGKLGYKLYDKQNRMMKKIK